MRSRASASYKQERDEKGGDGVERAERGRNRFRFRFNDGAIAAFAEKAAVGVTSFRCTFRHQNGAPGAGMWPVLSAGTSESPCQLKRRMGTTNPIIFHTISCSLQRKERSLARSNYCIPQFDASACNGQLYHERGCPPKPHPVLCKLHAIVPHFLSVRPYACSTSPASISVSNSQDSAWTGSVLAAPSSPFSGALSSRDPRRTFNFFSACSEILVSSLTNDWPHQALRTFVSHSAWTKSTVRATYLVYLLTYLASFW